MRVAAAHPGKLGDALYSLPTLRSLSEKYDVGVDFFTSPYCAALEKTFLNQSYVNSFNVDPAYVVRHTDCGVQPREVAIPEGYDAVYQLGFKETPTDRIDRYIAKEAGVEIKPFVLEYEPKPTIEAEYIILGPGSVGGKGPEYIELFKKVANQCQLEVVVTGAAGEDGFLFADYDHSLCGIDIYDTLPWFANATGFIGVLSSSLVLANSFRMRKAVPHYGQYLMHHSFFLRETLYQMDATANQLLDWITN